MYECARVWDEISLNSKPSSPQASIFANLLSDLDLRPFWILGVYWLFKQKSQALDWDVGKSRAERLSDPRPYYARIER